MSRSSNKGYYVDQKLLKKIRKFSSSADNSESSQVESTKIRTTNKKDKKNQPLAQGSFRTWSRGSSIHPEMIGKTLLIHNGKEYKEVRISSEMVGLKLGALAPTRKRGIHGKAGKR